MSEAFGKYVLVKSVGMGGMAEIFLAKTVGDDGREQQLALKRILPQFTSDQNFVRMFEDEAKLASHLKHENIVRIYDYGAIPVAGVNTSYIAMEFVNGRDLKRVIEDAHSLNKKLTIAQITHVVLGVAKALDYAHSLVVDGKELKLVHRDVTPHNVMITMNGDVKLMDFGIAKAATQTSETRAGVIKGKASYMSPEQARGKPLDGRSDMFTLGIMAWEMVTGDRLFSGGSDFDILRRVLRCDIKRPRELNPEVPEELDNIIMKMLEKNRDDRYANCGELADALSKFFFNRCPGGGPGHGLVNFMKALFRIDGHTPDEIPNAAPSNRAPATQSLPPVSAVPPGAGGFGPPPQGFNPAPQNFNQPPPGFAPAAQSPFANPYLKDNPFTQATNSGMKMPDFAREPEHTYPPQPAPTLTPNTNTDMKAFNPDAQRTGTDIGTFQPPAASTNWLAIILILLLLLVLIVGGSVVGFLYIKKIGPFKPSGAETTAVAEVEKPAEAVQVQIGVFSVPSKAKIKIDGQYVKTPDGADAVTPFNVMLTKDTTVEVTLQRDGYKDLAKYIVINGPTNVNLKMEKIEEKKEVKIEKAPDPNLPPPVPPGFKTVPINVGGGSYELFVDRISKGFDIKTAEVRSEPNALTEIRIVPKDARVSPLTLQYVGGFLSKVIHEKDNVLVSPESLALDQTAPKGLLGVTADGTPTMNIAPPRSGGGSGGAKRVGEGAKISKSISKEDNQDGATRLRVSVVPWGEITLDGKPVGQYLNGIDVTPGNHRIEVSYPGANRRDFTTVQVPARRDATVVFNFTERERVTDVD